MSGLRIYRHLMRRRFLQHYTTAVELARNRSAFLRNPCVIYGGGVAAYAKQRQSHKEVLIMHIRSPDKD